MPVHDDAITRRMEPLLEQAARRFESELRSDLDCVNELVDHVEGYRGKMLRPMLLIASGLAIDGDEVGESHVTAAAVVEMVHMATLVHDDVLDDAALRRGGQTVNFLHGNEAAVMLGDFLISHAYHLCTSLRRPEVSRLIAATTNTVCEGELLQLANRHNWRLDEATYFEIIRRKTASLCGVCCRLGGWLAGANPATAEALDAFGGDVGSAFQIVDDLLDLVGDTRRVGKSLGRDLAKGKLTLPIMLGLRMTRGGVQDRLTTTLRQLAKSQPPHEGAAASVVAQLEEHGAIDAARRRAVDLVESAKARLNVLPDTPARGSLLQLADAVVKREA